jgi:hypothetical protein
LDQIIKASDFITVLVISDGSSEIHGTPFDDKINQSYKSWNKELTDNQKLFVTVLRARNGKITDYAVNMPPWPFEVPPLPAELLAVKTNNEVAKQEKAATPHVTYLPPLILSGKKPDTAATQTVAQVASVNTTTNPPQQKPIAQKPAQSIGALTAHARTIPQSDEPASPSAVVALLSVIWSDHKAMLIVGAALMALILAWIISRACQPRSSGPISLKSPD